MAFKTLNKTSEYIRSLMGEADSMIQPILDFAEINHLPILLPESALVLSQLVKMKKPRRILEIGTSIGYSGNLMLKECQGTLYTLESDVRTIDTAQGFFDKNGFTSRVKIFFQDAGETLRELYEQKQTFDFIFMDGPKTKYIQYLPLLKSMLEKDGILLSDNVLFNGMVAGESEIDKKKRSIVTALDAYVKAVFADKDFMTSVLPVGDGLALSIKISD